VADEIDLSLELPGSVGTEIGAWRAQPPRFLTDAGFKLLDESYESLVYEANVTSRSTRILMFGMARTLYRVSITFRSEPSGRTRVTITGQLPEAARTACLAWADERAGA
jgi:hypothetical protein